MKRWGTIRFGLVLGHSGFAHGAAGPVPGRVADGGKGSRHRRSTPVLGCEMARAPSSARGVSLVTRSRGSEAKLIQTGLNLPNACTPGRTGSVQPPGACKMADDWRWITGEPWRFTDGSTGARQILPGGADCGGNGRARTQKSNTVRLCILDGAAECNGIVDGGQILDGTLGDVNANRVPDGCDTGVPCDPCRDDPDGSNLVNAMDLAAILFASGHDGGKTPEADPASAARWMKAIFPWRAGRGAFTRSEDEAAGVDRERSEFAGFGRHGGTARDSATCQAAIRTSWNRRTS